MFSSAKSKIRIVFFGTREFATEILTGLINSPFVEISRVITQADRPVGRKKELQKSPVKLLAEQHSLPIAQPESLEGHADLAQDCDVGVVAQYGLIIPKEILCVPPRGLLNVHGSILPKYRGASPIHATLMNGESETGVTIIRIDKGVDTGHILQTKTVEIKPDELYPQLEKKLAKLGCGVLLEALPKYINGELQPIPQDNTQATHCGQLSRVDGQIDWWHKNAGQIYNLYRGLTPWPGIWTLWNGKRLKLLEIKPEQQDIAPGKIKQYEEQLLIGSKSGAVQIIRLQLEGKNEMDVKTFLSGYKTSLQINSQVEKN